MKINATKVKLAINISDIRKREILMWIVLNKFKVDAKFCIEGKRFKRISKLSKVTFKIHLNVITFTSWKHLILNDSYLSLKSVNLRLLLF